MTAAIHTWCGRLDDPTGLRCACAANRTTALEVARRHREAVARARAAGWDANQWVSGEHHARRRAA